MGTKSNLQWRIPTDTTVLDSVMCCPETPSGRTDLSIAAGIDGRKWSFVGQPSLGVTEVEENCLIQDYTSFRSSSHPMDDQHGCTKVKFRCPHNKRALKSRPISIVPRGVSCGLCRYYLKLNFSFCPVLLPQRLIPRAFHNQLLVC